MTEAGETERNRGRDERNLLWDSSLEFSRSAAAVQPSPTGQRAKRRQLHKMLFITFSHRPPTRTTHCATVIHIIIIRSAYNNNDDAILYFIGRYFIISA